MTAARRRGRRMGLLLRPGHGIQSNQSIRHTIILSAVAHILSIVQWVIAPPGMIRRRTHWRGGLEGTVCLMPDMKEQS
jgi:hypothetical protein